MAIGNPLGELGGTVTSGIISALSRDVIIDGQTMTAFADNAAINPGNSGGGLFNSAGELIGIVNAKSSGTGIEGLGFAIPGNTVKSVVEELMINGYVTGRLDTGIEVVDLTSQSSAFQYGVSRTGIYVLSVTGTDGFRAGDQILSHGRRLHLVHGRLQPCAGRASGGRYHHRGRAAREPSDNADDDPCGRQAPPLEASPPDGIRKAGRKSAGDIH